MSEELIEYPKKEKVYCYRESPGTTTNLQLYTLKQAYNYWKGLKEKQHLPESLRKEIYAFITVNLGVSLSQLLGQNCPGDAERLTFHELFEKVIKESNPPMISDQNQYLDLEKKFKKLNKYYNTCKHFGFSPSMSKHKGMDELDEKKVNDFVKTTFDVWNTVVSYYRDFKDGDIEEEFDIEGILEDYYEH